MQFAHIKKRELYFVISSLKRSLSPSLALELLEDIVNVSADDQLNVRLEDIWSSIVNIWTYQSCINQSYFYLFDYFVNVANSRFLRWH